MQFHKSYLYQLKDNKVYYYIPAKKHIEEYMTDKEYSEPPFGHFFLYDRTKCFGSEQEQAIANAIFSKITKEQQAEAYSAFIQYAFQYDGYIDNKGGIAYDGNFYPSMYKYYRLQSLYDKRIVFLIPTEQFTGNLREDADMIANTSSIIEQIKSKFPPVYLFSKIGYLEYGEFHQHKANMLEKYILSTDTEEIYQCSAYKDSYYGFVTYYYGFVTLQEINERYGNTEPNTLSKVRKLLEISSRYFIGIKTGDIWKRNTYSLKQGLLFEEGGILPQIVEDGEMRLGEYNSVEECIEKNQEKLGIRLNPIPSVWDRIIFMDTE